MRLRTGFAWWIWVAACVAAGRAAEPTCGWRGNRTGLWPDAKTPVDWSRIPHAALEGLRCRANRPRGTDAGDTEVVEKGLIRKWLVIGPFSVSDAEKNFDDDALGGEATVEPNAGDQVAGREWKPLTGPADDPLEFGTAEPPWLDIGKAVGVQINQVAYTHTYLFSPRGGPARVVVDHGEGLKAWLNGREVYRQPRRAIGLGFYTYLSKLELQHLHQLAPRLEVELGRGFESLRAYWTCATSGPDGRPSRAKRTEPRKKSEVFSYLRVFRSDSEAERVNWT